MESKTSEFAYAESLASISADLLNKFKDSNLNYEPVENITSLIKLFSQKDVSFRDVSLVGLLFLITVLAPFLLKLPRNSDLSPTKSINKRFTNVSQIKTIAVGILIAALNDGIREKVISSQVPDTHDERATRSFAETVLIAFATRIVALFDSAEASELKEVKSS